MGLWNNPPYYLTAYGLAVKHGFTGTETQWLASLKGDPGSDLLIERSFDTYAEMITYYSSSKPDGFVMVGDTDDYLLYYWDAVEEEWRSIDIRGPQGATGATGATGSTGPSGADGADGADGVSVIGFELVNGNHAAGTLDTYYCKLSNGTNIPVYVYNGADGLGSGDMRKSIYDPQNLNKDVFAAIAEAVAASVTSVNGETGDVTVNHVALADNLYSIDNQEIYGGYIFRTAGGTASIDSGEAELTTIYGNTEAQGRTEGSLSIVSSSEDLSATINSDDWESSDLGGLSGSFPFLYDTDHWEYSGELADLADYGISVTGTPQNNDTLTVTCVVEVRGTLVTAKPTSFKAMGLNQFDKANNILANKSIDSSGNVVANTGTYVCWIHAVGGLDDGYTVYSSNNAVLRIGLSESVPTGSTTGIEIVTSNVGTSYVTPDEDCYICVVVSDIDTLCVHPKWSGYEDATYEAYSESTITIPTADANSDPLPTASYGIPSVGSVRDELSLDLKIYTKRIGQMAYSSANLATVKAMGVDYDYDATNIFYVLTTPVVYTLANTVSAAYTAADFGTEEFVGAAVKLYAQHVYGQNLRDKLRTDVVTLSAQTLTDSQKKQVRDNIDAAQASRTPFIVNNDTKTAAFHNSIYRGKDITAYLTDGSLFDRIKGTNGYSLFEDLYIGDYVTKTPTGGNEQSFEIVHFDYYINTGSEQRCGTHHAVFMPKNNLDLTGFIASSALINTTNAGVTVTSQETVKAFKWNATMGAPNTNSTAGGYIGSRMRQTIMPLCDNLVKDVFGNANLIKPDLLLPTTFYSASDGRATGWAWNASEVNFSLRFCDLPNETQIYGAQVWSYGDSGAKPSHEVGIDKTQFAIFRLRATTETDRAGWWLRSVVSAALAAFVTGAGGANNSGSSVAIGVRPRFLVI